MERTPARKKTPAFQFSLRSLLLAALVCVLFAAALGGSLGSQFQWAATILLAIGAFSLLVIAVYLAALSVVLVPFSLLSLVIDRMGGPSRR